MNNKKIILPVFIIIALVQLYVPASMIMEKESVLSEGVIYKFKTAPIDPNEPFRGKYIVLNYRETSFPVQDAKDWQKGDHVYAVLRKDMDGFGKIESLTKDRPSDDTDFFKTSIRYVYGGNTNKVTIYYPFNRYYMEESKAYDAELAYNASQVDTSSLTYAVVSIKNGDAVLKDVMINEKSIRDIVIERQKAEGLD